MRIFEQDCDMIFVSFDIDSINSKWMPGVSAPSVIGGISNEEALEIMEITGNFLLRFRKNNKSKTCRLFLIQSCC